MADLIVRLAGAVAIAGGGVLLYLLLRFLVLAKARRNFRSLDSFRRGQPGIVYFTTPDCAACKAVQRPALAALQERLRGSLQVIEIDAADRPDLAKAWSVLTVPTTFVLDRDGRPRHVNQGVASTDKLATQLRSVG